MSRNVKKRERMGWFALAGVGVMLLLGIILVQMGYFSRLIYKPIDMPEGYWIPIPAGEFQMGSENGEDDEKPVHPVYVDEFQIGKYEVTNNQYNQCIRADVCEGQIATAKLDHPVVSVNWYAAKAYCEWVGGRLPTEAEWEKAARGTDGRTYPWGEDIDFDCTYANYRGSNCGGDTTPVGSYESGKSPYGLYDMAGNVWEWVNDWYQGDYYATLGDNISNPQGPSSGDYRVMRGGSWPYDVNFVRSSERNGYGPTISYTFIGFRCARSQQ